MSGLALLPQMRGKDKLCFLTTGREGFLFIYLLHKGKESHYHPWGPAFRYSNAYGKMYVILSATGFPRVLDDEEREWGNIIILTTHHYGYQWSLNCRLWKGHWWMQICFLLLFLCTGHVQHVSGCWKSSLELAAFKKIYNWHINLCNFKMYNVLVWYTSILWYDYYSSELRPLSHHIFIISVLRTVMFSLLATLKFII